MDIDAREYGARAVELKLITSGQLQDCWQQLGVRGGPVMELVRLLHREKLMTSWQTNRLLSGKTDSFFLNRYKMLDRVAYGSFARVYRTVDPKTGDIFALKVLRRRWSRDRDMVARFHREGRVAVTLRHPNIVRTYEVAGNGSQHFIVMDFVEGGNLRDFLKVHGKLAPADAVRIAGDMARGLTYAVGRGLTHRDVKPSNILLELDGSAKLADFGLADLENEVEADKMALKSQRTVEYASLERATKVRPGDARSDIFFLGAILFQMVSGSSPFPEVMGNSRLIRRRFDTPPSLDRVAPDVPPRLAQVIGKMLSFDPEHRHQHVANVLQELLELERYLKRTEELAHVVGSKSASSDDEARWVLLVEQNPRLQAVLRNRFSKLGYRMVITSDARLGLERFKARPTDAVIVDEQGFERGDLAAVKDLIQHATARTPRPAVVVVQAEPGTSPPQNHLSVDRVLIKPSLRQLRETVQELVPATPPEA